MSVILGIDVGGTFTDFVAYDTKKSSVTVWKVFSNPTDPSLGVIEGLKQLDPSLKVDTIRLGTTIATNAVLERKGAKIAYLTTQGFRDIPFIQRGNRRYHFNSRWIKPTPLVDHENCYEVEERIDCDGAVVTPLKEEQLYDIAERIKQSGNIEALAINFLFSYIHPEHELRAKSVMQEYLPDIPISISYEVLPKWKEYERASTTIADAYLKPVVSGRLSRLEERLSSMLPGAKLVVVKSNGGEASVEAAIESPVQITLSGPTGGVVATKFMSDLIDEPDIMTFDMGGTSTDCCLCVNGSIPLTSDFEIEWGLPIQVPMIDIRTFGAGGGSIARIDKGGLLRVGPESAGSQPGPVCYDRGGTKPTVTDANVVLGRIDPKNFLGGTVILDREKAVGAMHKLAQEARLSLEQTAQAIIDIANNSISGALSALAVEKGHDPKRFTLMAFGGAGPLHISDVMKSLGISKAVVPNHPGQFSAFGFTAADARIDRQRTVHMTSTRFDEDRANHVLEQLRTECIEGLRKQGYDSNVQIHQSIDVRYHGQNYELELPLSFERFKSDTTAGLWASFDRAFKERYGFSLPGETIEVVNFNVTGTYPTSKPRLPKLKASTGTPAHVSTRPVYFSGEWLQCPIYSRSELLFGHRISGPAIIEESVSATCLLHSQQATLDEYGNIIIRSGDR
jgi:N-methylhydantoinase A